ncbi:MAG: hypothetical protein AAF447_01640 [Myxococcota bacterium]
MRFHHLTAAAMLTLTLVACGDSTAGFGTGLPAATPLGALTDDQVRGLCEDFIAEGNATFSSLSTARLCTFGAVFFAEDQASCEMFVNLCVNSGETPDMPFETTDPVTECADSSAADFDGCEDVTVGEIESCLSSALDAIDAALSSVSCSLAGTDVDPLEGLDDPFDVPECAGLPASCLEGLDGGDEPF